MTRGINLDNVVLAMKIVWENRDKEYPEVYKKLEEKHLAWSHDEVKGFMKGSDLYGPIPPSLEDGLLAGDLATGAWIIANICENEGEGLRYSSEWFLDPDGTEKSSSYIERWLEKADKVRRDNAYREFWGEDQGHSNRYVTVRIYTKEHTSEFFEKFKRVITEGEPVNKPEWMGFGGPSDLRGAEYGQIIPQYGCGCIEFCIYKGDYDNAKFLSEQFPEAIVTVQSEWDEYYFAAYKNGKEYKDYTISWDGGKPPEPYTETYEPDVDRYDCDLKVKVRLPWNGKYAKPFAFGGGFVDEETFFYFDNLVDLYPEKQQKTQERDGC